MYKNAVDKENSFLVRKLAQGDTNAYNRIVKGYYQRLCVYGYSLVNDHASAEDIVQDVFVSIWMKRKKIPNNINLENYLYRSVYNRFIDEFRKNKPVIYLEKKYLEAIDSVLETDTDVLQESIALLRKEISMLPNKCREVFLLNKKEGLTHIEISDYLGISIKTVEGHITKALKILNASLGPQLNGLFFLAFTEATCSRGH